MSSLIMRTCLFIIVFLSMNFIYSEGFKKGYYKALDYQCALQKECFMPPPGTLGKDDTIMVQHLMDMNINIRSGRAE